MAQPKKHVHRFVIALTFDKKCSATTALREAKDCIHGEHYTTAVDDGDPEMLLVKSIRALRRSEQGPD